MAGDIAQINGTSLSATCRLLANNPNEYKPNKGPYVYDATLNIAVTTAALLTELKIMMVKNIQPEKAIWTKCLVVTVFLLFRSFFLLKPKKSTQKEVVSAVSAESVVAKVAAVRPSINTIAGINPKCCRAIVGYR